MLKLGESGEEEARDVLAGSESSKKNKADAAKPSQSDLDWFLESPSPAPVSHDPKLLAATTSSILFLALGFSLCKYLCGSEITIEMRPKSTYAVGRARAFRAL